MGTSAETSATDTLVVLLAAGGGTRFEGATHKLHADLHGETVAAAAIRSAVAAGVGPVLIITGAADLGDTVDSVAEHHPTASLTTVHNPEWSEGQATSLAVAVAEAERRGVDAIVVGLADQPFIDPAAWRLVAADSAPIAIATYEGRRRNPVRLHRSVWPLLPTEGDEGARSVARLRPELIHEIPCPGSPADIDTLEDLASWQSRSSTNSP